MKKNNSTWNDILKPVVVLTVICFITTAILGVTNNVTAPIIEERARLAADAARIEMLPSATDGFDMVEGVEMDGVVEIYKAKNGTGYTITSTSKGYGGAINVMYGFDNDGKIVNLTVLSQSETQGLGSKITEESFLAPFRGTTAELKASDVDMISGATISSTAVLETANIARTAFNQYAKGIVVKELTHEEKLGALYGEGTPAAVLTTDYTHADAVEFWQTEKGLIVVVETDGFGSAGDQSDYMSGELLKSYVAFDETGAVAGVMMDISSEYGVPPKNVANVDYLVKFAGMTTADEVGGVDVVANATYTSDGLKAGIVKAMAVYSAVK